MANINSTIDKDRDCYGDLDPTTDDLENLASAVTGLLIEHPVLLRNFPYGGSAVYAKLVDALMTIKVLGDQVHPQSEFALRMSAIADGIVHAVTDRLKDHFNWSEDQEQEVDDLLRERRRIGICTECRTPTPRPRYWFCNQCEKNFAQQRVAEKLEKAIS